ncbi:A disintegrin and metalloproteinase with thrombospondin motifs 9 isoform X1 [Drosophila miranda]|uniref:A disintegrin and metalloproteinase with thrombospondin motifs 9 isoform X1 n=2 Tax=Drosophila miranda TaxID=7229 RepID=UPI00143F4CCF|nr:A disintegrin and metalloproteinase with thrombospondin motifs 9 isoform X1 [Drosophila miranda]
MSMTSATEPERCVSLLNGRAGALDDYAHDCGSATLRSTTSGRSNQTNSTTICDSPETEAGPEEEPFEDANDVESCLRGTLAPNDLEDAGLRYSYKGIPPELYSPKKDFIYKRPLVDRQLVLKKRCEWWFYRYKCSQKMSTHWRQHACLYACALVFLTALLFLFFNGLPSGHKARLELPKGNQSPAQYPPAVTPLLFPVTDPPNSDADGFEDIGKEELSAFVVPTKVYNYSLNEDDLLFESKRNNDINSFLKDSSPAFSMTGTFRSRSHQIWDPHPEYNLHAFGRGLHLVLHQDTSFIPNDMIPLIRILSNRTDGAASEDGDQEQEQDQEQQHYLGCYYKGYVEGDSHSAVAVSLCGGMTGYIKTGFGTLLIQPVNQTSSDEVLHRVWRHSQRNARHAVSKLELGLDALEPLELELERQLRDSVPRKLKRRKRHYTDMDNQLYTLEVLVAVDSSMGRFHKDDLSAYILILLSIVSKIFEDASIGNSIRISLVNLILLPDSNERHNSSNEMLKHFCTFANQKGYHYDTAMLITREPICGGIPGKSCHMLGLAELGTVCNPRSCSIVQDTGLPAAFTMAHELGHILNMPHDDDKQCQPYNTKSGSNKEMHIMSSVMGIHMHPWSWSKCSQHFVSEFLEKTDKSCLENTPSSYIPNETKRLPGEIYSLDNQCELIYGNQSTHCSMEEECQRLWCNRTHTNPHDQCRSSNLPWADGTPCNQNRHWCQKGKCVPRKGGQLRKVNGGWGPWTVFTPCSLTCGGGVQESHRDCNDPVPDHGGKYCVGSRKKYRSCNTHECPLGTPDPREQQCYDMNGRNFNIQGISPASKWIPKYEREPSKQCKLFCRVDNSITYFKLKSKVADGTTCTVDSFDKCVNGICRPAGCDNELNSIAKLDKCGVCEGQSDTCEEVTGNLYVSDLLKLKDPTKTLYYVTTIPKGASNIVITQPGYPEQNYIVLSDDKRAPILNRDVVKTYSLKFVYAGVTIEYNGSNSPMERVNTTYSWKLSRDLVVEIISIDLSPAKKHDTVLISYSYTIDKPMTAEATEVEIYRWEMQAWSTCDSLCQGRMYRQPACVSTTKGLKVAPQFCDATARSMAEDLSCNMDCRLTLNVTSISECSASCGELGTREKNFNCIQTFPDIQRSNIVDMSYCKLKFEVVHHEKCREGCWKYSELTACSKSCGTGTQKREVRCYLHNAHVSDDLCSPRTKHQYNELLHFCNTEPCPVYTESPNAVSVNNWVTGDWGDCNDWCKKSRSVSCSHPYGIGCDRNRKPKEVRNCCQIKYTSEWSECSVQCGEGQKRKLQRCTRVYKPEVPGSPKRKVYINDSYCLTRKVRRPTLRTTTKTCKINCKWITSNWTPCPADCSEEYQTRYVRCESWQGDSIEEGHCAAKKRPTKRRICNNCVRRQSKVISECNCDGYETRRVFCFDSRMGRIACPTRSKPQKHKCLPPASCRRRSVSSSSSSMTSARRPQSCKDLQRMHGIYKDGEYMLMVRLQQVRIYCHHMNSLTPREYISVEPQENYSIYYEYKTKLMNSCPPASREHEYYNDQNSGRTHFSKLRLNITDLRIIDNDFEFAESRGQRQKLGSAGDCYNRNMQCPQGDFSINLERTGFAMRPGTVWNTHGNRVVMKRSSGFDTAKLTRRAFCGGYCGGCFISPEAGLYLDVL